MGNPGLFDSVRVKTEENVNVTEMKAPRIGYRGERASVGFERKTRRKLVWHEIFDVVCHDPWIHFRINKDSFTYAAAGLPVHPTREHNFLALVVTFKTRCANATEDPGIQFLFDGKPETRRQTPNLIAHHNHILWQIQLHFRKK